MFLIKMASNDTGDLDSEPPSDSDKSDSNPEVPDMFNGPDDYDFKMVFTPGLANYDVYINGDRVSDTEAWDYMRAYERKQKKQGQKPQRFNHPLFRRKTRDLKASLEQQRYDIYKRADQAADELRHKVLSDAND